MLCSVSVYLLLGAGLLSNSFAISEGYILSAHFWGDTTELFDKDGKIIHKWIHSDVDTVSIDSTRNPPRVTTKINTASNGYCCYLLPSGNLLRSCKPANIKNLGANDQAAPQQGMLQEVDLDGKVVWADTFANSSMMTHHDFKPLPNGNILAVTFVTTTKDVAVAAGVDPSLFDGSTGGMIGMPAGPLNSFQAERIIEIQPDRTGAGNSQIVWQWTMLDHVSANEIAASHPERFAGYIAPLMFTSQWVHLNGIDYNPVKDLIVFSSRVFSEVYVIDHSTTSEQAKGSTGGAYGKGGDILYRWGHPSNYIIRYDSVFVEADTQYVTFPKRDTVITEAHWEKQKVSHEADLINCLHSPTWIPEGYRNAGNIMFFHNNDDANMQRLGNSQAVEINPWDAGGNLQPLSAGTPANPPVPTWVYNSTDSMYSASMSTAIRMKNGNTLVHEAYPGGNTGGKSGTVREVDPNGLVVGQKITLKQEKGYNPAKIMYYSDDYPGIVVLLNKIGIPIKIGRNSAGGATPPLPTIVPRNGAVLLSNVAGAKVAIYSLAGRRITALTPALNSVSIPMASFSAGMYLVRIASTENGTIERMISTVR